MSTKSAVIVSRNDNYGGNLKERAATCLNSMCRVFDEVVYVDWNSPKRSLIEEIRPQLVNLGKLKHIIITPRQAKELVPDPEAQDCCEVMGRNIGIRRATGDFVASTNIDIVPMTLDVLGLNDGDFMVAARRDVPDWYDIYQEYGQDDLIGLLASEGRDLYPRKPDASDSQSVVVCCGDFQFAHFSVWEEVRGFEETMVRRAFADTNVIIKARGIGMNVGKLDYDCFHLDHYDSSYIEMHIKKPLNDKDKYINGFTCTTNPQNWGAADVNFPYEII
jgi:hypothetical protein